MEDVGELGPHDGERGTPRGRRKPRHTEPIALIGDGECGPPPCPPTPSPQRQPVLPLDPRDPQSPSLRRALLPLSPRTPRTPRTPSRASNLPVTRLLFSPSPARVLTYGPLSREAEAESLPTPPPSSPAAKRRRLTDLPVPLVSPKDPERRVQAAESVPDGRAPASPTALAEPAAPATPTLLGVSEPHPPLSTPTRLPTPGRTSPAKHVSPACAMSNPTVLDLFALAPAYPTSSPLADRVRAAQPAPPPVPRPLSLRSRLRRARLSAR